MFWLRVVVGAACDMVASLSQAAPRGNLSARAA